MPLLGPIPVEQILVPQAPLPTEPPPGMTLVDLPLATGIPFVIPLSDGWSLVLSLPTGQARRWREAEGAQVVAASAAEEVPWVGTLGIAARAPLRLLVRRSDGQFVAAIPLAAPGRLAAVPTDPASPDVALFVLPLAWDLRAGNLVTRGDWGGRIRLAWRLGRTPGPDWVPPNLHPYVRRRLFAGRESEVGLGRDSSEMTTAQLAWTVRRQHRITEGA